MTRKVKERGVAPEPKPDRDQAAAARMAQRIAESEEKARAFAATLDPRQFQGEAMNLNFSQTTGAITKDDGRWIATGWAGRGLGKNNPEDQGIRNTGPLPRGVYAVGSWGDHPVVGPNSAALTAISGETYGRSGFYIHGPGTADYGQESKGCIVIPRGMRLMVQAILVEGSTLTVTV